MNPILFAIGLLLFTTYSHCNEELYCQKCHFHTMCGTSAPGHRCQALESHPPNSREKKLILDIHNSYRQRVAEGTEGRGRTGGQPAAAAMMKMEWDDELASIAQREADQCVFQHDCGGCRTLLGRDISVGQNIVMSWRGNKISRIKFGELVAAWYEKEIHMMTNSLRTKFRPGDWGHYTQMLWWNTRLVGCGASIFRRPDGYWAQLIFCNYGPTGNIGGSTMYKAVSPHEACSACPTGTACDFQYNKLCALQNPLQRWKELPSDKVLLGVRSNSRLTPPKCEAKGFRVGSAPPPFNFFSQPKHRFKKINKKKRPSQKFKKNQLNRGGSQQKFCVDWIISRDWRRCKRYEFS